MEDFQEIVTKRIQAELGNMIVQLTMKNVQIEQLQAENAALKHQLESVCAIPPIPPPPGPDSGQTKKKENSNGH